MNPAAEIVRAARSLFERGYSFGSAGNISVRAGDSVFATPTGGGFGRLSEEQIVRTALCGEVIGHGRPTKELPFHLAVYRTRPEARAVVHLHSTYATAVSCLRDLDTEDALPVLTPYYAMKIPCLPVAPYVPPADSGLPDLVSRCAALSPALLLRNHGPVTCGRSLEEAVALAEELEEAARLYFLLGDRAQPLTTAQVNELRRRFAR